MKNKTKVKKNIPFVNLSEQWKQEQNELNKIIKKIFNEGYFVGGSEVESFENNIRKYLKVKYAVALNSGTDALTLSLHLLGVGKNDEVITPPNSFIASTASIIHLGAKPVFVDVLQNQNIDPSKIEKAITSKTKVIMPVHLTGRVCQMDKIMKIAKKYNLKVVEDSAQAIGSKYQSKYSGTFGSIGCFSTHPLKNLNSCGDGGFIITNNKKIYTMAKSLRNHGIENRNIIRNFGYVSRMDNLQAGILNYRIKKLNSLISQRRKNAKIYFNNINSKKIVLPFEVANEFNTYHTFVIQTKNRNLLKQELLKNGIETAIHYPIPIHLQPASAFLGYKKGDFAECERQSKQILTIPIHQYLKKSDIDKIIHCLNKF